MRRFAGHRAIVLAMVGILVVSVMAGSAFALGEGGQVYTHEDGEDEHADEVFIDADGNAAFLYNRTGSDTESGEVGVDVAEGIVYALVTDETEEDLSAAFDLWLEPNRLDVAGEAAVERPDALESLELDVSAVQTAEESSTHATLSMTADASEEPSAEMIDTATSEGQLEVSADHFATSGHVDIQWGFEGPGPNELLDVSVSGTSGDYEIDIAERRQVADFEIERWETEEAATETLEGQYGAIAEGVDGEAAISIHEHDLSTDDQDRNILDISYSIEYTDIDGIGDLIAAELADDASLDLTEAEAQEIADSVLGAELNNVDVTYTTGVEGAGAEWTVDITNLQPLAESMTTLIAASAEGDPGYLEEFETFLEAQQSSDLVQTTEWTLDVERQSSQNVITVAADLQSDATNWEAYVAALEEEGIDVPEVEFEAFAELVGEEIAMEVAMQAETDQLLDEAITALGDQLEQDPTVTEDELAFFEAFESADLEISGVTLDMNDGTMTLTAGASFADMSAFEDVIREEYDGLSAVHFYGDVESGDEYIYAVNAFDADVDEETVRSHSAVGENTTITFVDSFDDLPRMDLQNAGEYLGVEVGSGSVPSASNTSDDGTDDVTDDGDDSVPGFGAIVALIALAGSIGVLRRRR